MGPVLLIEFASENKFLEEVIGVLTIDSKVLGTLLEFIAHFCERFFFFWFKIVLLIAKVIHGFCRKFRNIRKLQEEKFSGQP